MDRFSTRLAASLIDDRRREAAAARRFADSRSVGPDAGPEHHGAAAFRRFIRPLRLRAGAR